MEPKTPPDIEFINELLGDLFELAFKDFREGREWWDDDEIRRICEYVTPIKHRRELESALPSNDRPRGRLGNGKLFLFLHFVEKERALPILDMSWNLAGENGRTDPIIRFRFFLLHWARGASKPSAVGFRFEPPEGPATRRDLPGNHDYWHAQMISGFEKGDDLLSKIIEAAPGWVPTKQPAIPLPAQNLGDLFAALLLSIYGARQLTELTQGLDRSAELTTRLQGMLGSGSQPRTVSVAASSTSVSRR